jgi:hypothetical protein
MGSMTIKDGGHLGLYPRCKICADTVSRHERGNSTYVRISVVTLYFMIFIIFMPSFYGFIITYLQMLICCN